MRWSLKQHGFKSSCNMFQHKFGLPWARWAARWEAGQSTRSRARQQPDVGDFCCEVPGFDPMFLQTVSIHGWRIDFLAFVAFVQLAIIHRTQWIEWSKLQWKSLIHLGLGFCSKFWVQIMAPRRDPKDVPPPACPPIRQKPKVVAPPIREEPKEPTEVPPRPETTKMKFRHSRIPLAFVREATTSKRNIYVHPGCVTTKPLTLKMRNLKFAAYQRVEQHMARKAFLEKPWKTSSRLIQSFWAECACESTLAYLTSSVVMFASPTKATFSGNIF